MAHLFKNLTYLKTAFYDQNFQAIKNDHRRCSDEACKLDMKAVHPALSSVYIIATKSFKDQALAISNVT